jgi:hypothetical protein
MPHLPATFSAVTPMWQSSKGSVSAPTIMSEALVSPMRRPQRIAGTPVEAAAHRLGPSGQGHVGVAQHDQLGGRDDGLEPGAAQPVEGEGRRLHRQAAVDRGHPGQVHVAGLGVDHVAEHGVPDLAGSTPDRLTASRTTAAPRSAGGMSFKLPPYFPTAVRTPKGRRPHALQPCSRSLLYPAHMYSPPLIP